MTGSCAPVFEQTGRETNVEVRLLKLNRDVRSATSQYGEDAKSCCPMSRNKMRGLYSSPSHAWLGFFLS